MSKETEQSRHSGIVLTHFAEDEPEFIPTEWQEEQAEKRRKLKQEFDDGVDSGNYDYV